MYPVFLYNRTHRHHMTKGIVFLQKFFPEIFLWVRLPSLISWFGLIIGIVISSIYIPVLPSQPFIVYQVGLVLIVPLFYAVFLWKKSSIRFIIFIIIGIMIFQIKIASYINTNYEMSKLSNSETVISGTVVTSPSLSGYQFQFQILTDSIVSDNNIYRSKKRLVAQGPIAPLYGAHISLFGTIQCPSRTRIPLIFDEFNFMFSNGVHGSVYFDSCTIDNATVEGFYLVNKTFRSYVLNIIDNFTITEHRSILRAAFLGEKTFLQKSIKSTFRKSGIYHLLAISGLHAGMLIGATYFILLFLPINLKIKHCIVLFILWTYQYLIGWSPSLLRASIMATTVICTFFFEKKCYSLQSLGIAGITLLIISPGALFNPGYQLSFCASTGIILLFPKLNQFTPTVKIPILNKIIYYTVTSFFISLSSFLSTVPILIYYFGTISLFGLLANIIAVLLMTIGMWLFFLSLVLYPFIPVVIKPLCDIIASLFTLLIKLASLSDSIPISEITLPVPWIEITLLYVLMLLMICAINKKHVKKFIFWALPTITLISILSIVIRQSRQYTSIVRFTSPESSYTAIRWPGGETWLIIDHGNSFNKSRYRSVFDNWMHHSPGSYLKKTFLLINTRKPSMVQRYDTVINSGSKSVQISRIPLTRQSSYLLGNETALVKTKKCSSIVNLSSTIPVLHVAQGTSAEDIPLTKSTPEKNSLSLIHLNGKKAVIRTYRH